MINGKDGRKRASSLRTQMFNKHLYDTFKKNEDAAIELADLNETEVLSKEDEEGDIDDENIQKNENDRHEVQVVPFYTRIFDIILNRRRILYSKNGRHIPIALDHSCQEYQKYTSEKNDDLVDERTGYPYCTNQIRSSRYTVYSFFPQQLYAQFSKLANVYFFLIAILQMIPGWSTTGTYTTIIPLCIFMGISMAREAWDDLKRHKLDVEENNKLAKVLVRNTNFVGDSHTIYSMGTGAVDSTTELVEHEKYVDNNKSNNTFTNLDLLTRTHNIAVQERRWKDLKVGDFVFLAQDEWIPADLVLLTSDGENGTCYVETMALDGETNLKSRQPHPTLSQIATLASGLAEINAKVTVEDPNINLYKFEGNIELEDESTKTTRKFALGPDNVVYRGSILRNTKNAIGIVMFTGEETKIRMNALRNPRTKAPKLQRKINMIIVFMVLVVAIVSLFSYLGQVLAAKKTTDDNKAWYLYAQEVGTAPGIMTFIIMYNTMIPLSLYVTMEIIKVFQSKFMEWDIDMYHAGSNTPCESRTATILEELGQVSYIFSDKTGTLTDNKMVFRKFTISGCSWVHNTDAGLQSRDDDQNGDTVSDAQDYDDIKYMHNIRPSIEYKGNSTALYTGRPSMRSLRAGVSSVQQNTEPSHQNVASEDLKTSYELVRFIQAFPNSFYAKRAKFFILSLALCHTCLPKKSEDNISGEDSIEYQSSSPDELALVTAARDLGFVVFNKNGDILTIKTYPNGFDMKPRLEDYRILDCIEFNSQRKRMSVIVQTPGEAGRVLLICKGADNVILERLKEQDLVSQVVDQMSKSTRDRKNAEAEIVIRRKQSLESMASGGISSNMPRSSLRVSLSTRNRPSLSLQAMRRSLSVKQNSLEDPEKQINSIDAFLDEVKKTDEEIGNVMVNARASLRKQQQEKYNQSGSTVTNEHLSSHNVTNAGILDYIGDSDILMNDEYVLEKTLEAIDDFSTEGLRTLLYAYKWISRSEYDLWSARYNQAKTSLVDRTGKIDMVGEEIETDLSLLGATAIEDKLQEGVSEAVKKIHRAGIKMWMLTGDKRETAINIGYSCKLIHDFSTVVVLTTNDENIISKLNALSQELDTGNIAHCVVVFDGNTLSMFENNPTLMSVFVELCTKTDSVICCRASPSQKALMVSSIRNTDKNLVTLAIGDGANDIAMIQSADIGVGIAGKEGLQASRSSDYSIAQFRFLLKLLLVHGRYNYVRTAKFILCTFYKEVTFYLTQLIYQRYTIFSGTSLYESWSLSMYNTLFTSLPVLCIGILEKDLKPITLLSVPELYVTGRLSEEFNLLIFVEWLLQAGINSVLITFLNVVSWGQTALSDNTIYPLGVINYTAIVLLVNAKSQFLEMHNRNWLVFASVIISCGGWLLWVTCIPVINKADTIYDIRYGFLNQFGGDITFWCSIFVLGLAPIVLDAVYKTLKVMIKPSDTDIFTTLEQQAGLRKKLEFGAYNEMRQGWEWDKDPSSVKRYYDKLLPRRSRSSSHASSYVSNDKSLNSSSSIQMELVETHNSSARNASAEFDVLPSGKRIKKHISSSNMGNNLSIPKKLRFKIKNESEEDVMAIVEQRMHDLE